MVSTDLLQSYEPCGFRLLFLTGDPLSQCPHSAEEQIRRNTATLQDLANVPNELTTEPLPETLLPVFGSDGH